MPKVIRAADSGRLAQIRFDDVTVGAADGVTRARAEAERLVAEASQAAALVRQQAEAEGQRAAEQANERLIEQKVDEQLTLLRSVLTKAAEELQQARHQWQAQWEKQAIGLALSIARRVVRRELRADPDIPVELVREALQLATGAMRIRLLMNPNDVEAVGRQVRKLLDELAPVGAAELIADAAISPGGCRVETEHGAVDQQFAAQLSRIAEELT